MVQKNKKQSTSKRILAIFAFILITSGLVLAAIKLQQSDLKPKIAVIPIKGEIGFSDSTDPIYITKTLQKIDEDVRYKAIILDINSPGGSVVASKQIAEAIKRTKKPIVALIREVGASGALWVAVSADKVVADPASITGSIGVTASYLSFEKLMEKYGITYNRLVTGEYKDIGSPYKELTPKEKEKLMEKIEYIKNIFVQVIAENRNLSKEFVENISTGEIWLGVEAQKYGIVDYLGGEEEAKMVAEKLANITNAKLQIIEKKITIENLFTGNENSFAYWFGKGFAAAFINLKVNSVLLN
ncbi:MAG: signal peptide peptidase SppA [Candidatus Nanoarchaeia archaeon]